MSLQELSLDLDSVPIPEKVVALIAEADRRCDAFYNAGLGRRFPRYIPSNPAIVHAAIVSLREAGHLRGDVFCEWGCGFAVATCIASLIGFQAYGVEIEPELAELAVKLAEDHKIPVEILNADYLPEGYEECEGVGGKDLLIPEATTSRSGVQLPPSYEGLDPDEVDLFFVYPWPGQEELMMDLFRAVACPGSILLIYLGDDEIAGYLLDEHESDY